MSANQLGRGGVSPPAYVGFVQIVRRRGVEDVAPYGVSLPGLFYARAYRLLRGLPQSPYTGDSSLPEGALC